MHAPNSIIITYGGFNPGYYNPQNPTLEISQGFRLQNNIPEKIRETLTTKINSIGEDLSSTCPPVYSARISKGFSNMLSISLSIQRYIYTNEELSPHFKQFYVIPTNL